MAHNTTLDAGSGGDVIVSYDIATAGAYPTTGRIQQVGLYLSTGSSTAPTVFTLGQKTAANSIGVVLASDQAALAVTMAAVPTGGSTAALQTTGNTSLSSIDGKLPALGQALAAASVPVVLTAAQITTLTPLATVAATQSGTWNITNVSGTVSLPTGAATAAKQPALGTAGSASTDVITIQGIASGTVVPVSDGGGSLTVDGTFWQATQPVSGTVTANAGSGTFTIAGAVTNAGTFATQVTSIAAGDNNIGNVDIVTVPADPFGANADAGSATGSISAKLRFIAATGIPITGTVTVGSHAVTNAGTFAVQVDGTALTRLTDIKTNTDSGAVVGNGAAATAQRVSIANDSTGILAGVTTVTTVTTVSTLTGGGVAHDSADSGNPVKIGARAAATLSDDTMVANADRTDAVSDLDGALITRPQFPLGDIISERVSNTDGASTAFTNFGATSSTRNVITSITAYNASATGGYIDFRDGAAGSILYTVPIPAGGGVVLPAGATPYFRTTANTALAFDVSAALTTVYISVTGFKSKV